VDLYVLFFIHVGNRRVFVSGVTANPDSAWVSQQASNATMQMAEWGLPARFLLLDHDAMFTRDFDRVFEAEGTEVKRVGPVAPNLNAYAERWAQSLRTECLDHFVVLGEGHLRHILKEYLEHYNRERPHQAKGNVPLPDADEPRILQFPAGEVACRERLGGLFRHYHRQTA
jgi:putative transposase